MNFIYVTLICMFGYVKSDGPLVQIEKGINEFVQTKIKPTYIQNSIDDLYNKAKSKSASNNVTCNACIIVTNALLKLRRSGSTRETILELITNICVWFFSIKEPVCREFIDSEIDVAVYIVDNKLDLTAERICSIRLQEYNCIDPQYEPWNITIPPQNSEHVIKHPTVNDRHEELVLHLTDFHYDPLYEPGTNTECDFAICCQSINGKPINPKNGAGFWGDYKSCDAPWHSIQDVLQQVVKQHPNVDRVYYTGDMASHQISASSQETRSGSIKKVLGELKQTFKSIPVYPVLGNHETHPSNFFNTENITDKRFSTQWALDLVADGWGKWLPNDTQSTIRKGGYYTVLVKPGFRIIGLNSNLWFTSNLWLVYSNKDPHGQLQWLLDTLSNAENNKEVVHILAHAAPVDKTCLRQWNSEFLKIVDRFSNIIAGQFYGHTHLDQLKIFYSSTNLNQVTNVAFTGGSLTPSFGYNPNYRVYCIDRLSWNVDDYSQWIYNLQEANQTPQEAPKWYKLYSFKDAYGLEKLDPSAYHELLQKMARNNSLIQQYRRFTVRNSSVSLRRPCEKECVSDLFCSITNVNNVDSSQCKLFREQNLKL